MLKCKSLVVSNQALCEIRILVFIFGFQVDSVVSSFAS